MAFRGREKERSRHHDEGLEHKLYIGGLPIDIGDNELREAFSKYGNVDTAIVMKDHDGRSRSFGFVKFHDSESVDDTMKARDAIQIRGRQLEIRRAFPREMPNEQQVTSTKLFVGGCRGPIDDNALREYFSKYGNILSIEIIRDKNGETRGFGFIEFDDFDACDKIILEGEHRILGRQMEIRKYLNREQFENVKRRNAEQEAKQGGPPPPPYASYGPPPAGPPRSYGNGSGIDFERERMPLWERLFGLSDEERARELIQVDDEYFIYERERLERQLRELGRLEIERRRVIDRMRSDRGGGFRERSPLGGRGGDYDRREPPMYHTSYGEPAYMGPPASRNNASHYGNPYEHESRRYGEYRQPERDSYRSGMGPPVSGGGYRR